jgi:zinc D-Ala-D-Ala dipeptidase
MGDDCVNFGNFLFPWRAFGLVLLCFLNSSCKSDKSKRQNVDLPSLNGDKKVSEEGSNTQAGAGNAPAAGAAKPGEDVAKLLEGKLVEVVNNTAIAVKMNYAGNKIFCTPKAGGEPQCLISEPLYKNNRCFLRKEVKDKLQTAALLLQKRKPGFKITMLDCYRPISVQKKMFEKVANPVWVAAPTPPKFGGHNRGVAVDVTLQDTAGKELDMGSLFDEFSSRSVAAANVGTTANANRALLSEVFSAAGLKPYAQEWWHFSLDLDAPALDIPL